MLQHFNVKKGGRGKIEKQNSLIILEIVSRSYCYVYIILVVNK